MDNNIVNNPNFYFYRVPFKKSEQKFVPFFSRSNEKGGIKKVSHLCGLRPVYAFRYFSCPWSKGYALSMVISLAIFLIIFV